ncbi:MAG: SpoIID/LytB domain-containing protein [Clostridiales bacterium]|nr:SpoIID/LytB domain-containing protein [Clostridiales bacterium]
MNEFRKQKPEYSFWIGILVFGLVCLMFVYGRKEQLLYQEWEEKIRREQKAGEGETHLQTDSSGGTVQVQTGNTSEEPQKVEAVAENPVTETIRVLLMNSEENSSVHQSVILQSSAGITVKDGAGSSETYPSDVPLNLAEILPEGGKIFVSGAKPEGKLSVLSLQRSQGVPSYEGTLEISRDGKGFQIINEVDLETYLKYVVPSEMPASYPEEALKAQAVCARTFAVRQMEEGRLSEYGADVDDTVSFQVYNNIPRQDAADRAVDETCGTIMSCEGKPIQAYFFSTSCGNTSTDEVWGADEPEVYLKSVSVSGKTVEAMASGNITGRTEGIPEEEFRNYILTGDPLDYEKEEPWYRWEVTLPLEMVQNKVSGRYPEIGEIQEFVVGSRSSGGAARKLIIKGNQGEAILENEYDIREFFSPGNEPITCNGGTESRTMKILPSAYFVIDPVKEGEELKGFAIQGGGYGHGVGMSQNGAKDLAENGMDWKGILHLFYQKITFSQL